MLKKTLLTLGLLAMTTLSGCVVVAPPPPYVVAGPAVVYPVVPVFGWFGGCYYGHGYYRYGGYRGGYGYRR